MVSTNRKSTYVKILAIVAVVGFAFVACGGDFDFPDDFGNRVQRPGAPGNVTSIVSPCQNWAIVSWTVGANHRDEHEIFKRQAGTQTMEPLQPVHIMPFFNPLDQPRFLDGPGGAPPMAHTILLTGWNADSSLVQTPAPNRDRVSAVVPLFYDNDVRPQANFNIGVRTVGVFDQGLVEYTHSPVVWASGNMTFRPFTPHGGVFTIAASPAVGTAGTAINLNTFATTSFHDDDATLQAIRWEVRAFLPFGGAAFPEIAPPYVVIPSVNGVFMPSFMGQYYVRAVIPHADGPGDTRLASMFINVNLGTPFVQVTSFTGAVAGQQIGVPAVAQAVGTVITPGTTVVPAQASNQAIEWSFRSLVGSGAGAFLPAPPAGWAVPPPPATAFQVRGIIRNALWWAEGVTFDTTIYGHHTPAPAPPEWTDFIVLRNGNIIPVAVTPITNVTNINWQAGGGITVPVPDGTAAGQPGPGTNMPDRAALINLNAHTPHPVGSGGAGAVIHWERQVRFQEGGSAVWVPVPDGTFILEQGIADFTSFGVRAIVVNPVTQQEWGPFVFTITTVAPAP
ncbi:MAG: hypothetical protein FWC64_00175 [Treponema sp.]|nr:hypothetical protein [Treponema sp.]